MFEENQEEITKHYLNKDINKIYKEVGI